MFAELWYSADTWLVNISLNKDDGTVVEMIKSTISGMDLGQNCLTMLEDGSLFGARLSDIDSQTRFYHILDPPRDGRAVTPVMLGVMPDDIMIEALYTDCDGRLYGMDTGQDVGGVLGNRLLRFTGDYLSGDFSYQVVSDLSVADVADIDDMGPGIGEDGEITDNPGLAIDSGNVYDFNYETGHGAMVGAGGTWGIHALGKELFNDNIFRLYLLNDNAELYEMDHTDFTLSQLLGTGPLTENGYPGWSGLTGPLTNCVSGFIIE
jgi:hypothetical protein